MFRIKKRLVLVALLLLALIAFTRFERPQSLPTIEKLEVTTRRSRYSNPIYAKWKNKEQSLEGKCKSYFGQFNKLDRLTLEEQAKFQHDGLVFKKTKWLREEGKKYRKESRRKHKKIEDNYESKLLENFYKLTSEHSKFEEAFVNDMAHMRAFGRCFLEENQAASKQAWLCEQVSPALFPFLLGEPPRIDYNGNKPKQSSLQTNDCFAKQLMRKGQGDGIVIPILPGPSRNKQLVRAIRLIKVLRASNNTLPIEITFMDDTSVRPDLKKDILLVAKRTDMKLPESFGKYLTEEGISDFSLPEQEVRFVYLQRAINKSFFKPSESLMMSLAPLLCSFERAIVLSTQTIPLARDISEALGDPDLEKFGVRFFKSRAIYEQKLNKFPPGYFETNQLVNGLADVSANETKVFDLTRARNVFTGRVRHESYTQLIDTSMAVIDKPKALAGLLMSTALQFYPVINSKYDFSQQNFESLWLGQELTGRIEYVPFNANFASVAGILTPPENVAQGIPTRELCSSSWAQISDKDDSSLLYVTTHQIENRILPVFDKALSEKYLVKVNKDPTDPTVDDTLHRTLLKKNPLRLETVLRPMSTDERHYNKEGFAELPWNRKGLFGSLDDYWCAYDIVGSTDLPLRGVVTDIPEKQKLWYNALIEIWLLSSHQQSSSMGSYE